MARLFTLLFFLGLFTNSFGQQYYYYKPWKKTIINNNEICLTFDNTISKEGDLFLKKITHLLSNRLNSLGHKCVVDSIGTICDNQSLTIKLTILSPAYVQLEALQAKIPLCNRLIFQQINPLTDKRIDTIISVSVDKEEEAIAPLVDDLAQRLSKLFKK